MNELSCVLYMQDMHLEEQIADCLRNFGTIRILDILNNEVELLERLKFYGPEILLVNMDIKNFNSADFIRLLSANPPFILGFSEDLHNRWSSLDDGFFDIIKVPFDLSDFCRKMAKILKVVNVFQPHRRPVVSDVPATYSARSSGDALKEFIMLKHRGAKTKLRFDDISYVRNVGNVLKVVDVEDKSHYHSSTLAKLLQGLPPDRFARINKSVVVNCKQVEKMEHQKLYMMDQEFKISRTYSMEFMEIFNNLCVRQGM